MLIKFIYEFTQEEWNELVEQDSPLVENLKPYLDVRDKRLNEDLTISLKVDKKEVKTSTPTEIKKRAEREKAVTEARAKQEAEEKKELEDDLKNLANIWKNSRSMQEICRNCNDAGLTGPITRNRKSIQGMRHDKKFISDNELDAKIPDKVSSIELSEEELTPLVKSEIKEIFQELLTKKFDGDTWTFSDLSGQSMLKSIMDKIAGKLDYDKSYILIVQNIIVKFFQEVVEKGNLEDPELDVYITPNGDRLAFSNGFCKVAISEL